MDDETVRRTLSLWAPGGIDPLSHGPYFVLGYKVGLFPNVADCAELRLTFEEKPSRDLSLVRAFYETLSGHYEFAGIKKKDVRFLMTLLTPTGVERAAPREGILVVAGGIGPDYHNGHRDGVDAMHMVDGLGLAVLKRGMKHRREPSALRSNYNFAGISHILGKGEDRTGPEFYDLLQRVRGRASAQV